MSVCRKCNILLTNNNWTPGRRIGKNYICQSCAVIVRKISYDGRKEIEQSVQKARAKFEKQETIKFYGSSCASCGLNEIKKLTIDHIDNTGGKHRKTGIGDIYGWLYRNKFPTDNFQLLCYNCNCTKTIAFNDKHHLRNKEKVMAAYGGQCNDCGVSELKYLTIDHSNNDGAEQRRSLSCGKGSIFYRWLIANNFPKNLGLQVLCYNCNCSKLTSD
jgi:hypothetical protein